MHKDDIVYEDLTKEQLIVVVKRQRGIIEDMIKEADNGRKVINDKEIEAEKYVKEHRVLICMLAIAKDDLDDIINENRDEIEEVTRESRW